jgi:hypothetical protein
MLQGPAMRQCPMQAARGMAELHDGWAWCVDGENMFCVLLRAANLVVDLGMYCIFLIGWWCLACAAPVLLVLGRGLCCTFLIGCWGLACGASFFTRGAWSRRLANGLSTSICGFSQGNMYNTCEITGQPPVF